MTVEKLTKPYVEIIPQNKIHFYNVDGILCGWKVRRARLTSLLKIIEKIAFLLLLSAATGYSGAPIFTLVCLHTPSIPALLSFIAINRLAIYLLQYPSIDYNAYLINRKNHYSTEPAKAIQFALLLSSSFENEKATASLSFQTFLFGQVERCLQAIPPLTDLAREFANCILDPEVKQQCLNSIDQPLPPSTPPHSNSTPADVMSPEGSPVNRREEQKIPSPAPSPPQSPTHSASAPDSNPFLTPPRSRTPISQVEQSPQEPSPIVVLPVPSELLDATTLCSSSSSFNLSISESQERRGNSVAPPPPHPYQATCSIGKAYSPDITKAPFPQPQEASRPPFAPTSDENSSQKSNAMQGLVDQIFGHLKNNAFDSAMILWDKKSPQIEPNKALRNFHWYRITELYSIQTWIQRDKSIQQITDRINNVSFSGLENDALLLKSECTLLCLSYIFKKIESLLMEELGPMSLIVHDVAANILDSESEQRDALVQSQLEKLLDKEEISVLDLLKGRAILCAGSKQLQARWNPFMEESDSEFEIRFNSESYLYEDLRPEPQEEIVAKELTPQKAASPTASTPSRLLSPPKAAKNVPSPLRRMAAQAAGAMEELARRQARPKTLQYP